MSTVRTFELFKDGKRVGCATLSATGLVYLDGKSDEVDLRTEQHDLFAWFVHGAGVTLREIGTAPLVDTPQGGQHPGDRISKSEDGQR